jgi:hypothetical protein
MTVPFFLLIHIFLLFQGFDGHGRRHGFIDSNREGIISSIGYFILYMFGVEIGLFIFKKDRYIFYRSNIWNCNITLRALA